MFKKILFFVILAGIGFGIYTGIHKIFEVVSAPKTVITTGTTISMVTTGSDISVDIAEESTGTVEEITQAPGWFSRTWTNIKTWFSSKRENIQKDDIAITGDIVPEPSLSGEVLTGDIFTGDSFEEITSTGTEVEEVVNVIIDTGVITTKAPTTPTVVSKPTTTKTTTVKKPSTTTTKTTTSTSGKDPILDALFR